MAKEDVILGVKVEGGQSLASLKQEFKELNKELENAAVGTKEYQKTLEKLGNVNDEMKELRETIASLNPEGKVQAFSSLATKLAGGFEAATGAAALFGSKSEEIEKQLLKVQGAIAFANGVKEIVALDGAFKILKATLLSLNPIFLIITGAIVAISAAYLVWSKNMSEAAQNDAILNAELERQVKLQNEINKELDRQLEITKAIGGSEEELRKAELAAEIQRYSGIKVRLILLQNVIDKTDEQREEIIKLREEERDSDTKILVLKLKKISIIRAAEKKADDEARAERKKRFEEEKALSEKRIASIQDQLRQQAENEEAFQIASDEADQKRAEEETEKAKLLIEEKRRIEQIEYDYLSASQDARVKEDLPNKKEAYDQELRLAQQQADAKQEIENKSFQAAQILSDTIFQIQLNNVTKGSAEELKIRKKQFEVNKAFSIALTIIDGIRSVQAALTIPPPAGPILAVLNGVLAAANVARIATTQFNGGSVSAPTIPSTSPNIPSINTPSTSVQPGTRLNPDGTPQTGQYLQAYVLEKDITDKQKQTGRIQKQGSF